MQCKEVEAVLEREGFVPMPQTARAHVAGCSSCQSLVADLTAIVATAHLLPADVEPPARVWASLRAQLEREDIIRPGRESRVLWWQGFSELFRTRVLATAAVGFLIVVTLVLQVRHAAAPNVARNVHTIYAEHTIYDDTSLALNSDEAQLPRQQARASLVDVSLRQNLDIVDNFIADCERRVKEQPQDDLAREYLSGAYQQKAELLSVMMEREGGR
jgi:hypothetical protein